MRTAGVAAALVALALSPSACAESTVPDGVATYSGMAALAEAAGCSGMRIEQEPEYHSHSGGQCGDVLLLWFKDDAQQEAYEDAAEEAGDYIRLVGVRWTGVATNGSPAAPERMHEKLGGKLVGYYWERS